MIGRTVRAVGRPSLLLGVAAALALAVGCGSAPAASPAAGQGGDSAHVAALPAGPLPLRWQALALPADALSPVLAPGHILWLAPAGARSYALVSERWPVRGHAAPQRVVAALGLAVGRQQRPALLTALGPADAVAAVVPQSGLDADVVANVWALGPAVRTRLADLDPPGTRPRQVAGQPVVVGAPGAAMLSEGASRGFPAAFRPAGDLLVRLLAHPARVAVCRLPVTVSPGSVLTPAPGVVLVVVGRRVDRVVGCPARVRLVALGRLPPSLEPLLAGVAGKGGRLRLAWVAGTVGTRLGAWRAPTAHAGQWSRIWSVPATAIAVTPLPPGLLAATAVEGDGTASRIYQAATGRSAGPYAALSVVAGGDGAALVRRGKQLWLVRPKATAGTGA